MVALLPVVRSPALLLPRGEFSHERGSNTGRIARFN